MPLPPAISDLPPLLFPEELPISAHRDAIAAALRDHPVTIICGDTGSGKTTQLPKMALSCGRGRTGLIGCTQPRRLATLAMARRVAEEVGQEPGRLVGYQHRFDRQVSAETRIKFMTDGILLAETRRDPLLRGYDTLIIDEAHERSLNIDFLLGLIKTILPRRPDLRVLVSSATLDAGHFAEFFGGAQVLRIPGRLFPIDIRYRPPDDDDADLPRLIANAVDELGDTGDILVFLPGERDIRETGEVLTGRRLPHTEIIPLLASLPAGEQQRAFRLSSNRRIILATNVAETSVTLPGIRYVIDSGLARISRYSHRTQVQRLQIEPVSQASANQRAGRCGRLGPGVCVRLYAEDDYRKRDPYTDPEILRASLAGVILAMLDLRLGDIATFPFLDPPSPAMIKEGFNELEELGAVRRGDGGMPALTPLGQRLARLPVEPRLARILLAAHDEKALRDALIVVAALECDEPRRRPLDKQADADRLHGRFLTPHSDFAALLQLWRWYEAQNPNRSQSVARRLCHDNYLSYPRMRDWRDLREQLAELVKRLDLDNQSAAGGDTGLHRALLTGLLSHIGKRDPETGEYRGARGLRFALFPGSGLAKARPAAKGAKHAKGGDQPAADTGAAPARQASRDWIVAGELVDTSRLYARQAACIDPAWLEQLGRHLSKSTYHSPEWDALKGFVRVRERITLYGLVLVDGRLRDYSRICPAEARALFIRHGLVAGEFPNPPPFLRANQERVQTLRLAEEKTRRHGQLVDEEALVAFYDRHLPADICNADALRRWLRQAPPARAAELELQSSDLPALGDDALGFPDAITLDGHRLEISYRHSPGEPDDGITCVVPCGLLPLLRAWRSDWLVPGALPEKIHWMLTALPSKLRRLLLPTEETAALCLRRMSPGREPLAQALARAIYEARGVRVPMESWCEDELPDHLRIAFKVVSVDGRELGQGRNFEALLSLFGATPGATAAPAAAGVSHRWQRDGLAAWECGALPGQVDLGRAGWPIINYPALVDAGTTVSLRLFADDGAARAEHVAGVCRLLLLGLGRDGRALVNPPSLPRPVLQFLAAGEMDVGQLGSDVGRAAVRRACLDGQPDVRDAEAFARRLEAGRRTVGAVHAEVQRLAGSVLHEVVALEKAAAGGRLPAAAADDVLDVLAWLVFPGFVWTVPWTWLQHYPRYLEGVRVRLERLALNPAGDARRQAEFAPYWQRYTAFVTAASKPPYDRAALQEYRWLTEEYRVSCFAQELRTAVPVSAKRLDLQWQKVTA